MPEQSITVQSVIFHTSLESLEHALAGIERAVEVGRSEGMHGLVRVSYGDSSPSPMLTDEQLERWRTQFPLIADIRYEFFGENLGHGGGQNRLASSTTTDLLVISNPDIIPSARALGYLARVLDDSTVGIAEGKQLPLEHPKDYDRLTGATAWASGAFAMFRTVQFQGIGGFDHHSFFMYGDDVDLSWRFRSEGHRVIFQPAAAVFHDKRLNSDGAWAPTEAERYYSAESSLFLAYKWSRDDILETLLANMSNFPDDTIQRAVREFERRRAEGELPERLDPTHKTAEFAGGNYAAHRW